MIFNQYVKKVIGSFLKKQNFFLQNEYPGFLKYEHEFLTLSFTYDYQVSFEVEMVFYCKKNNQFFNYSLLREYLFSENQIDISIQLTTDNQIIEWIKKMEKFLEEYLSYIVNNHKDLCADISDFILKKAIEFEKIKAENHFKINFNNLWEKRDFHKLVELVENYSGILNENNKKKYHYAIKKIGDNSPP